MGVVFKICIPHTSRDYFDYRSGMTEPCIGARVKVSFGTQTRVGIVIGKGLPENPDMQIKTITSVIDEKPLLSNDILTLCQWISHYYQSPLSEVFALALPKKIRQGEVHRLPTCPYYDLTMSSELAHGLVNKRAFRQHALIDFIASKPTPLSKSMILKASFKSTQLDALVEAEILAVSQQTVKPVPQIEERSQPLALNEEQSLAVQTISSHLQSYRCFLLQGVTGSGKTEVYLQVIAQVLTLGKQVLVLVPEIGLTPQLLARFSARFQEPIAIIHSNLNDTERQIAWQSAAQKESKLVMGTRSALFTPMPALGLIVIDEEHDLSFKHMDGVRYSARDTALIRAHTANIPIILGSATPSLESLHNVSIHKYTLLSLTQKALNAKPLQYRILDIRNQSLQHGLANPTLQIINDHLQQQNQVLVFINRRGFSPVLLCHQCGWMADCRGCDSHLTLHRRINKLICHHCGLAQAIPTHCQSCQSCELIPVGAGTQRIHEFLATKFPSVSLLRIDRDEVSKKHALNERLARIHAGEAQLIVGTQMLAKGHHFPRLTLVVILDADHGLYSQDFRALERLGQLLTQVSGRAGRAERAGQVIIQTHLPQHPLLNLLIQKGYEAFAQSLLSLRQQAELPPYHFLAIIRAQSKTLNKVLQFLHTIKDHLQASKLQILGPAPAPLARKADYHRMQLLIKSSSRQQLKETLTKMRNWLTTNGLHRSVRWNLDVDPVDLS